MDPLTHTLTGTAMAGAGLRRATPLATATVVLAANAPDIDILSYAAGPYAALAFRRGVSHGPLAWVALPFLVAGAVMAYDRWIRRRRRPGLPAARAAPLLAIAALGVATHPLLDWLNNYGLRWLMPFHGRWYYGDALFIVDPYLWLVLGGVTFVCYSRTRAALLAWALLGAAATAIVVGSAMVPLAGRAVWLAGLAGIVALRVRLEPAHAPALARWGLAATSAYVAVTLAGGGAAHRAVHDAARTAGIGPVERVMVAPVPAHPLRGSVLVQAGDAYHLGDLYWLRRPAVRFFGEPVAVAPAGADAAVAAATATRDARHYLAWARFPFFRVTATATGYDVGIGDARYGGLEGAGSLRGFTVHLDPELRPITASPRPPDPRSAPASERTGP